MKLSEKKVGKGRACYIPLNIPASRFLIPSKEKGEFTTFGPTMANVFADIPEGYTRGRIDPALRVSLEATTQKVVALLDDRVTRLVEKKPYVEITAMAPQDGSRMLVHFVNYDVTVDGEITPAKSMDVQVALPNGKKARSVHFDGALAQMRPLQFSTVRKGAAQVIRFQADEVQVYGLAVVELE